jgi:enoyl-CoA hydratase/carnithine racemase
MAVVVRSPGEILDALRSPYAAEELVEQGPVLAISLDRSVALPEALLEVGSLPVVVAGISDGGTPRGPGLDVFDLLLTDRRDLDAEAEQRDHTAGGDGWVAPPDGARSALEDLARRAALRPQASVTLAQLLRLSRRASVANALVAESLAYATLQAGTEFRRWLASREPPRFHPPAARDAAVALERDGTTLRLRFCRPEIHNAFGTSARDELVEGLQLAAADPTIRCVHLSGEGRSFCSGGDLREFGSMGDPAEAHLVRSTRSPGRWLHHLRERVVVELHGACIGAGIELAAFGGEVVAHGDTRIQLPELDMGLVPGAGGTVSLPRRMGRRRTAWLCLSGAVLDAQRALRWGLVDRLAPDDPG